MSLGLSQIKDTVHIEVTTLSKLFTVPLSKRKWGMRVTVIDINTTYVLTKDSVDSDKTNNGNWVIENTGATDNDFYGIATGTDTYVVSISGFVAYSAGQRFIIYFPAANTVANPTLNVSAQGAKTIVKNNGDPLSIGDIGIGFYMLSYDGAEMRLIGVPNSAIFNDVYIVNQAATSGKKRFLYVDDTGKINQTGWVELDTINQKVTWTGVDDLDSTVLSEWKNASGNSIMKILNGQKVQFGGSSCFLEVPSGIADGSAGIIFLDDLDLAYRMKDGASFDYLAFKSSDGGYGKAVLIKQKQVNNHGQGFETIRRQFKLTLPNTTAGAAHIVGSIDVPAGYGLQLHVHNAFAFATNGNAQGCEPFSAIGKNASGTTSGASTAPTALRITATTGGFSIVWNDTTDTADLTFTNETGTGRQYDVLMDVSYIVYPIPV